MKTGTFKFQSPLSGTYLREILSRKSQDMQSEVAGSIRNIVQNPSHESKYIASLVNKYKVSIPKLDFNNIKKTDDEREWNGSELRGQVFIEDRIYTVWVVTFHIPYTGDVQMLKFVPRSGGQLSYPNMFLKEQNLCFEISSLDRNVETIKSEKERTEAIRTELTEYNANVEGSIRHTFEVYKQKHLEDKKRLEEL